MNNRNVILPKTNYKKGVAFVVGIGIPFIELVPSFGYYFFFQAVSLRGFFPKDDFKGLSNVLIFLLIFYLAASALSFYKKNVLGILTLVSLIYFLFGLFAFPVSFLVRNLPEPWHIHVLYVLVVSLVINVIFSKKISNFTTNLSFFLTITTSLWLPIFFVSFKTLTTPNEPRIGAYFLGATMMYFLTIVGSNCIIYIYLNSEITKKGVWKLKNEPNSL